MKHSWIFLENYFVIMVVAHYLKISKYCIIYVSTVFRWRRPVITWWLISFCCIIDHVMKLLQWKIKFKLILEEFIMWCFCSVSESKYVVLCKFSCMVTFELIKMSLKFTYFVAPFLCLISGVQSRMKECGPSCAFCAVVDNRKMMYMGYKTQQTQICILNPYYILPCTIVGIVRFPSDLLSRSFLRIRTVYHHHIECSCCVCLYFED